MNQTEDPRIADARLRETYIALGFITPADQWRREVDEFEASRNSPARKPGLRRHVNPERSRAG